MPSIEGLDPALQTIGTLIFVAVVAIFSGWSLVFGRRKPLPETGESSVAGKLADTGPVKEMIEQAGLLVQQQIRTNIILERLALAVEEAVQAWGEEREQHDREEEIERRVAERLAEETTQRRRAPRKAESS